MRIPSEPTDYSADDDAAAGDALRLLGSVLAPLLRPVGNAFDPSLERRRLVGILRELARFARFVLPPNVKATSHYLHNLALAIHDLDRGVTDPLLVAGARPGKVSQPTRHWIARAELCVAMEALVLSGKTTSDAAKYVAKRHDGQIKPLVGKKAKNSANALESWLDQFRARRVKIAIPLDLYEHGVSLIKAADLHGDDLSRWADSYLSRSR